MRYIARHYVRVGQARYTPGEMLNLEDRETALSMIRRGALEETVEDGEETAAEEEEISFFEEEQPAAINVKQVIIPASNILFFMIYSSCFVCVSKKSIHFWHASFVKCSPIVSAS